MHRRLSSSGSGLSIIHGLEGGGDIDGFGGILFDVAAQVQIPIVLCDLVDGHGHLFDLVDLCVRVAIGIKQSGDVIVF